jgi:hypothetical protein
MPRESPKNAGESVRARLLQRSRDEHVAFQILLTRYALERLLYRLTQSAHRRRFVLKGAMLFATWVAVPFRPTRDLDLLGYGENSPETIRDAFREICGQMVVVDEMCQWLAPAEHEFQFPIGVYFVRLFGHRGISPAMTRSDSLPRPQPFATLPRSQNHCLDAG